MLFRLGQQLVGMGRTLSEGVEALGVQLDVSGNHGRPSLPRSPAGTSSSPSGLGTG